MVKGHLLSIADWFVGLSLIGGGIFILTTGAFRSGAMAFNSSETDTMMDLGIITDVVKE